MCVDRGHPGHARVLGLLNSPTYADLAIPQVWARELDEGRYWCSVSTMYRIARAAGQTAEQGAAGPDDGPADQKTGCPVPGGG